MCSVHQFENNLSTAHAAIAITAYTTLVFRFEEIDLPNCRKHKDEWLADPSDRRSDCMF